MQITEYVANRFRHSKRQRLLVGVCGRAGAGKTTLVRKISAELGSAQIENVAYSGDWRFILDSRGRKEWLDEKWRAGMDAYLHAVNQFSWWDFEAIFTDLTAIQNEQTIRIGDAYDRATGTKSANVTLGPVHRGIILYENCILGPLDAIPSLDIIVLLNTSDEVCLERLLRKDAQRRPVADIATRYLMTTYSENIFLRALRERFSARTVACDSDGNLGPFPDICEVTHIPVPIGFRKPHPVKKGTIFCDLDGTVIKHVAVPSGSGEDIELLDGSVDKLKEFRLKGYHIVLTTSRSQANIFGVLEKLRLMGLECDQVICDLPVGPRHLINDSKDQEVRAIAHALTRDAGLKAVKIQ
jgi:uridine kinase